MRIQDCICFGTAGVPLVGLFVFCANACAAQDDKTTQTHLVGDDTTPLDCNLAKAAAARSIEAGLEKREIRIGAGFAGLTQQPAAQ